VGAEQVLLEAVEKVSTRDGRAAAQVVASQVVASQVVASQVVAAQVVPAGARMVVGAADRCVAVCGSRGSSVFTYLSLRGPTCKIRPHFQ
jgi:hypothetical protein